MRFAAFAANAAFAVSAVAQTTAPAGDMTIEEVPFVTSPDNVTLAMLEMAKVGANDVLLDLGSGDGRIVIVAARRFGAEGLGVELDPSLVSKSRDNARLAGVESKARFAQQDLFATDLSKATVVTLYLLPSVNMALRPRLLALAPGTRVVSHDWDMGEWLPDRTVTLPVPDKKVGREKSSKVHLWTVPAQVEGRWCARAAVGSNAKPAQLLITQKFQQVVGELDSGTGKTAIGGSVNGNAISVKPAGNAAAIELQKDGERLRVVSGELPTSVAFDRAVDGRCG